VPTIRFGTEGWRAVIADEYTFDNVRATARAAGRWFKRRAGSNVVAVGHDTRFLGDRFAAAAADELADCGLEVHLCSGALPTPAACFHVVRSKLAGAVVLTASHNPAQWNGVKVKRPEGASVMEDEAKWIGDEANRILKVEPHYRAPARQHDRFDVREAYLEHILSMVDREAISRAQLAVVADIMHGAGGGYFDEALRRAGCAEVRAVRAEPDPTFGGKHPEPIGPNLEASIPLTADPGVAIGLATDGDGDRLGMMAHGEYVDIMRAIVFVLYHLLKNRRWRGTVVRAINVTSMLDRLAGHYNCEVIETSVGFKNIAPQMVESPQEILLAVEESGGFGIRGHIPDRDGSLAALMACEALAYEGKPVRDVLDDIFTLIGAELYFDRIDIPLQDSQRAPVDEFLSSHDPDTLAGKPMAQVNRLDGSKYLRKDGTWVLLRLSGTEPLVRVYAEGTSPGDVHALLEAGREMVMKAVGG
jgi:phosphomannomutase